MSHICSATFAENKRMGVVKPGAPLSDDPGLFALANLFYDTIMIGSEQLTIGKNSMEQYVAFMKTLSKQYEADDTSTEYQKSGLSGIRDKRDEKLCGNNKEDIRLTLDTTNKVYDIVKSMFQAQVKHAAECLKIINRLFNITYDKTKPISIKLHDNLISKGFPELESINRDARELLIQYYTNCENKYIQGMTLVLNEQKAKKEAANAATKAKANANAAAKAKVDAALRAEAQRKIETQQLAAENKLADAKKEQARIIAAQQATQAERQDAYRAKKAEEQRVEQERRARMEALAAKRIQEQQEQEQRTAQKRAENERIIRQRMELNERARQRADEAAAAYQRARQL
jgi:predicted RNA-binding protein with PUA-like domain